MPKTIFILLDACRWDVGTDNAGYLEHLVDTGKASKYKVLGELPSMSRPMYETLLTGLPSSVHGIVNNEINRRSRCDNLFRLCRAQGLTTAAACYFWMSELYNSTPYNRLAHRYQLDSSGDIQHGIFYWEDFYPDTHLVADGEYLRRTFNPDFLVFHSMNIDLAGHRYGGESKEYALAIAKVMELLAQLLPIWMEEGYHIVITADHGMNSNGHHGGPTAAQRTVPLYVISSLCKPGRFEKEEISQLNVAPLLCRMLGLQPAEGMIDPKAIKMC